WPTKTAAKANLLSADLLRDLGNLTSAYGTSAFTDRKPQSFFHRYRSDQFHVDRYVITRHYHFHTLLKFNLAGYVCGSEIELRTILVKELRVTSTFIF